MTEWDRIRGELPEALSWLFSEFIWRWNDYMENNEEWDAFVEQARERYERGRAQHADSDSTWEGWTDPEFLANIREELIDAAIYAAARRTRRIADSR